MAGTKKPSRKPVKRGISRSDRIKHASVAAWQSARAHNAKVAQEQAKVRAQVMASYLPDESIEHTFAPLYEVLDQIERTGEIDVVAGDRPVFHVPNQGGRFALISSLRAVADTFALYAQQRGGVDQGDSVRRLAMKLDVSMPLMESDLTAARAALDWMRGLAREMTVADFLQAADRVKESAPLAAG